MDSKKMIALKIALQTHVLHLCPIHQEIYGEQDTDPSAAFALAVDWVRQRLPYVEEFQNDAHALTDLLSETIGAAPSGCPLCANSSSAQGKLRAQPCAA